jgi:predicted transcriptional regulator
MSDIYKQGIAGAGYAIRVSSIKTLEHSIILGGQ